MVSASQSAMLGERSITNVCRHSSNAPYAAVPLIATSAAAAAAHVCPRRSACIINPLRTPKRPTCTSLSTGNQLHHFGAVGNVSPRREDNKKMNSAHPITGHHIWMRRRMPTANIMF